MPPKILIIPARKHSAEAYSEYLIRYLSDEFHIEMGYPIDPGNPQPFQKDPDKFDLIYPHFDSHWFLDQEKYAHKVVLAYFEPHSDSKYPVAATAGLTQQVMEKMKPEFELRFGVDIDLFAPYPMLRTDDFFHVGFVGNIQTPRRYLKELFMPLKELEGVKLDLYPASWLPHTRPDEVEQMGGQAVVDNIVDGDKWWPGFPNCYNQMDIFVRCDIDPGYQFTVLEAAACGIPVVTTDPGLGKELCDFGGGIYVECQEGNFEPEVLEELAGRIREAVVKIKTNTQMRGKMSYRGREFVKYNYTWDKWAPKWREFFRKGLESARS